MLTLASLVKTLKKYAKNQNMSDEDFLNEFLSPVVARKIINKNGELFYLNKSRTSKVLAQKEDVPSCLRMAIGKSDIKQKAVEKMPDFINKCLDVDSIEQLRFELSGLIEEMADGKKNERILHNDIPLEKFLTELLFLAIAENNKIEPKTDCIWKQGNSSIRVISGDLFRFGFENRRKVKNIVVIPVNTAFDTHVTRKLEGENHPLVSENTIHGQWLIRMEQSGENLEQIYERIIENLNERGILSTEKAKSVKGRVTTYPIGSIAIIETNNAVYFLLAISTFDELNMARSSSDRIETALRSLLQTYEQYGQGYDLYLPLLGTGRSRAGLSVHTAYQLIKNCFIGNLEMIHGHIYLVMQPEARKEIFQEENCNGL